jgi:hypothetical protein
VAISKAEVQSRLQPYLLVHFDKKVLDLLTDSDFVRIFNDVAKDLNEEAHLNQERWKNEGSTTTAEDSSITNFLMQGLVLRVYSFKFESSSWQDQRFSYIQDRIVLKESADGTDMDIQYLRDCEDVSLDADEIDLPNQVLMDYVNLVEAYLNMKYGEGDAGTYEEALRFYGQKAQMHVQHRAMRDEGVRRSWFDLDTDDNKYDLSDRYWVGMENFTSDASGNYTYVGE